MVRLNASGLNKGFALDNISGVDIDQLPQSQQEESPVEEYQGPKELDLPDPELGNLKYLEELLFRASRSVFGRDLLTQAVERTVSSSLALAS